MQNTNNLEDFGFIELHEAGRLLVTLKTNNDKTNNLGSGLKVEFNPSSGNVFLVDEDYNVAMMNGDTLEDWYMCPYCGHEGFLSEIGHEPKDEECKQFLEDIGYFGRLQVRSQ